jgi:hypothetical protein
MRPGKDKEWAGRGISSGFWLETRYKVHIGQNRLTNECIEHDVQTSWSRTTPRTSEAGSQVIKVFSGKEHKRGGFEEGKLDSEADPLSGTRVREW